MNYSFGLFVVETGSSSEQVKKKKKTEPTADVNSWILKN